MLEMTHKLKRIQMQNEIVHSKKMEKVNFPRNDNKTSKIKLFKLPSNLEIISEVNQAREEAIVCLKNHKVHFRTNDLLCPISLIANEEEEEDSSDEGSEDENDGVEDGVEDEAEDEAYENDEEIRLSKDELNADLQQLSSPTGEILLKNYSRSSLISISETSPFTAVRCSSGKEIVVRKSSIVWLLSTKKSNLSSDRLVRVQESEHGLKRSKFTLFYPRFYLKNCL